MKTQLFRCTFFLLAYLSLPQTATAQVISIPDANLRAAIENALGVASGATITATEMATLTRLEAPEAGVRNLTGLEHATHLMELFLNGNAISDLSPLAGLTNLTLLKLDRNLISDISAVANLINLIGLHLWQNSISDLSPLAGLTKLTGLYLGGSSASDLSPLAGLTNLESLFLDANGISNLSALAGLTKLTRLALNGNSISDLSPLVGLTNLKWMRLAGNNISDLSPLVANTGLGSGDTVDVWGNPLSYLSIKTHIPALKSRGVTVEFDDITHLNFGEPRTVRLIYFLPSDRSPQQDIDTKLDRLIKDVQQFYADEMERHGFGRKTFTFETDATQKAVVHHVEGQFTDSYYRQNTFHKVWEEIREQFYTPQNIYFIAIDIGNERVGRWYNEVCGVGNSQGTSGGHVLIPAAGDCFNFKTAAHELGHAFGLQHDFRNDTYIMSLGSNPNKLSECAVEWLDAHRYFNPSQSQTHSDNPTTIQMLTPFASPPYAIGLRFEVTDPDGVHQAQLLTPATIRNQGLWQSKLLSCKRLSGETDTVEIEFITNKLTAESNEVTLSVINVYGNFTAQTYPIDITTIFPTETASTPDTNQVLNIPEPVPLSLTVRDAFELDPFYQQWIDVEGLPVVASAKVNPYALKEAAWQIWQMIGHRPDVLQVLAEKQIRFTVIGYTEILADIPEYSDHIDFLTYRQRGSGGSGVVGHSAVTTSEENLLHYPGDTGGGLYNVLIHELAHAIHLFGLNTVDPTFDTRLKIAYDAAVEKGLWQGTYAASDRKEYWAEGTHAWFYPKGGGSFNNYGNTRDALKAYDPGLASLLAEIYGDTEWRYTPPAVRLHLPHLQGFNPENSPTFRHRPELEELNRQFRDPNSDGGDNWVDLRPYDPSLIPILNESRVVGNRTMMAFVNLTQAYISIYSVGRNGTERFWTRARPGRVRWTPSRINVVWLIKDPNGKNLVAFQAEAQTGRAIVSTEMSLITPGLSKISGDNQTGISGAALPKPFVVEVRDENLSVLEGISVTFTVVAGDGTLSVTHTTTNADGQAESRFTLGTRLGPNSVSVSAAGQGEIVVFNVVTEAAVNIPDPNLRAAIEGALSKAAGVPITASEIAALPRLDARNSNINDLTGLEHATRLRSLDLDENNVRDITPLKNLTQLTWLLIGSNPISDFTPLSNLNQLEGLSLYRNQMNDLTTLGSLTKLESLWLDNNDISNITPLTGLVNLELLYLRHNEIRDMSPLVKLPVLRELWLEGNPLSEISMNTHIPALQRRGVEVEFDDLTHLNFGDPRTVRLIYFLPNDRPYRADVVQQMKDEILKVQTFYAEQMGQHGFGRKTFTFETDATGKAMVHRVDGQFTDSYYHQDTSHKVWQELAERFYTPDRIYMVVIDTDLERLGHRDKQVCGDASEGRFFMPGSGPCFSFYVIAHELGHTFGLRHDFRSDAYMLSYGITNIRGWNRDRISQCAAEWLDVHSFFNVGQSLFNNPTTIRMLPPLASPKAIRLRFEVTDPDGLHQAQLIIPTTAEDPAKGEKLHGCKRLRGESNTIEFITTELTEKSTTEVALHVIDVHGNITRQRYPIQLEEIAADPNAFDVNGDGNINVLDLILIASNLGNEGTNIAADIDGNEVVDILDLVLVAGMFEGTAAAPAAQLQVPETLTAVEVQGWLTDAISLEVRDLIIKRGIMVLDQLLAALTPTETELLPNYPNPFNPETWIPYRLAEDAFVTLTIYDGSGRVVRTLDVGHRIASAYESQSKAIYWDGRNGLGEQVASGVYFYTLTAGDYSATRKMLIVK